MKYKVQRWETEPTIRLLYLTGAGLWSEHEAEAFHFDRLQARDLALEHQCMHVPIEATRGEPTVLSSAAADLQLPPSPEKRHQHPHGRNWIVDWERDHDA